MPDDDIIQVWKECEAEIDANHKMGQSVQELAEQTIGNMSALKSLQFEKDAVDTVKNS